VGLSVAQIAAQIATEHDAYLFMERLRWGDGPVPCAHCHSEDTAYIKPRNGRSRATRTGAMSERRVWRCRECRRQFSAITGTVFHGTKVPLRTWVLVVFEMAASKNGVSAREVERKHGVCPRTAWFMMHRIREAMAERGPVQAMAGVVQADETFIGGKVGNRHKSRRRQRVWLRVADGDQLILPGMGLPLNIKERPSPQDGKTPVLSLISVETGQARSVVVPDVTGATLRKAIAERVRMSETVLHTDEHKGYKWLAGELAGHETVNHSKDEYARRTTAGLVTTNAAEGFFSQLKRSLDGTHHRVSRVHLHRYLAEFDYRYSTRRVSDESRMQAMVRRAAGRRLTYKRVIERAAA
jgi:transposase-like protein